MRFFADFSEGVDERRRADNRQGKKGGKFQFDLTAYIAARLEQAKITQISVSGRDTYSEEACFFSYRRSVHKGEPDYGRALSMIALAPEG